VTLSLSCDFISSDDLLTGTEALAGGLFKLVVSFSLPMLGIFLALMLGAEHLAVAVCCDGLDADRLFLIPLSFCRLVSSGSALDRGWSHEELVELAALATGDDLRRCFWD